MNSTLAQQGASALMNTPALVALGLDPNARDEVGNTALHVSGTFLHEQVFLVLEPTLLQKLAAKSSLGRQTLRWLETKGATALYMPFTNTTVLRLLLNSGVDPQATNRWGETAMHRLFAKVDDYSDVWSGNESPPLIPAIDIVRELVNLGLSLETVDRRGMTLFLHAVEAQRWNATVRLLELGANPHATNRLGQNALHLLVLNCPDPLPGDSIPAALRRLLDQLEARQFVPRRPDLSGFSALERAEMAARTGRRQPSDPARAGTRQPAQLTEILRHFETRCPEKPR